MTDLEIINQLSELRDGWNDEGAIAPNHIAVRNATMIQAVVDSEALLPEFSAIGPDVEGGIELVYVRESRYASVTADNDGYLFLALLDQQDKNAREIDQVECAAANIRAILLRMLRFVLGLSHD